MAPVQEDPSLFHLETLSLYIALPPSTLGTPYESLCATVFSPLLLTYYTPARGVVLSYSKVRLSSFEPTTAELERASHGLPESAQGGEEELLLKAGEYSAVHVWATAELLVFRPVRGAWITAQVAAQAASHFQLTYLNAFAISVLKENLPSSWKWVDGGSTDHSDADGEDVAAGYWVDEDGAIVQGDVQCRITKVDFRAPARGKKGFFGIEGSLRAENEEVRQERQERRERAADAAEEGVEQDGTEVAAGRKEKSKEKRKKDKKDKKKHKGILKERPAEAEGEPMEVDG